MHVVRLRNEAIQLAQRMGYQVSEDWLPDHGGGLCVLRGQKRLILDLAQNAADQLESVAEALRDADELSKQSVSQELADYLNSR